MQLCNDLWDTVITWKKTKSTYSTLPFLSDRQLLIENFWQPKEEIANAGCSEQDRLHHLQGPVRNKNMRSLFKMSYGLQDNDSRASNQGESSLEHGALCDFPDHRPTQPAHLRQKTDWQGSEMGEELSLEALLSHCNFSMCTCISVLIIFLIL